MSDIILVDRNEVREVEQEEKAKWIRSVLEKMKLPLKKFLASTSFYGEFT